MHKLGPVNIVIYNGMSLFLLVIRSGGWCHFGVEVAREDRPSPMIMMMQSERGQGWI